MKKLTALLLALALLAALCACGQQAQTETPELAAMPEAGPPPIRDTGTLSLLNMTPEQYAAYVEARSVSNAQLIKEGYGIPAESELGQPQEGQPSEGPPPVSAPEGAPEGATPAEQGEVVFYDTLDAMLMALNAGDIDSIEIYQSVARYLCATNDNLRMGITYDTDKAMGAFAELVQTGHNGNDFAFLLMEDRAELRDLFNAAITGMKADGTMDRLIREQIDDLIDGGEIKPIALPKIDGAETIRVAVTGALPPMDYVAADGTPAGFNTAVLAEIGQRTGKNIELVVVDSLGRAAALASGVVDAVFWTRTSSTGLARSEMTEEQRAALDAALEADLTEEENQVLQELLEMIDMAEYASADMPEGTIVTVPYYSDVFVPVDLIRSGPKG